MRIEWKDFMEGAVMVVEWVVTEVVTVWENMGLNIAEGVELDGAMEEATGIAIDTATAGIPIRGSLRIGSLLIQK
jgi:hypothetical protein